MRICTRLGQGGRASPCPHVARERLGRIAEVRPAAAGGVRKCCAVARVHGACARALAGPPPPPPPARSLMRGCGKSPDVPSLEGLRARGRGAPGREQLRIEVEEHRSATLGPSRRPHRCSTPAGMAKTAPAVSPGGTTRAAGRCQAQKKASSPGWSSAEAAARACAGCLGPHPEPIGSPAGVGAPAARGSQFTSFGDVL